MNYEMKEAWKLNIEFNRRRLKMNNQPERSKREDSLTFQVPIGSKAQKHLQEAWDICEEMRCSEQSGN